MDKKTFRKICIERAKANRNVNTYKLDKDLSNVLYKLIKKEKAKKIMLYIPLKIEVNISSLIWRLRKEKIPF